MSNLHETARPLIDLGHWVATHILDNENASEAEKEAALALGVSAHELWRMVTVQCELCGGNGWKPINPQAVITNPDTAQLCCNACSGKGRTPC